MHLPYKINSKQEAITILIMIAAVATSFYFYQNFPEQVPTHWNIQGQSDDFSGKAFAAFFFPALIIGLYLLMMILPIADPQKERYKDFSNVYNIIRLSLILMLTALYFVASLNGLGYEIPINFVVPIGVGILFIIIGNFLPKVKKNWFVGIRTPWTMSSEEVWNKSHRLGGKLFIIGGILMILTTVLPTTWFFWIFIVILILLLGGTIGYSWWLWRSLNKSHKDI